MHPAQRKSPSYKRQIASICLSFLFLLAFGFTVSVRAQIDTTPRLGGSSCVLSELDLTLLDQDWNAAKRDQSVMGNPLRIAGKAFTHGIGTHANSRFILKLGGGARRLQALVGVDDGAGNVASVRFSVHGDGRELWNSGIRKKGDPAVPVSLDVTSVKYLSLEVDDGGDGKAEDHADWVEPMLTGITSKPLVVTRLPEEEGLILPGRQWADTQGNLIQAHGGGILYHDRHYYWYG